VCAALLGRLVERHVVASMRLLGGLLLVALVAGCGSGVATVGSKPVPAASSTTQTTYVVGRSGGVVVPWLDRPMDVPVEPTTTTTSDAPACASDALSAGAAGVGGAAGTNYFTVTLKSAETSWCSLHSVTEASALDNTGRRVALNLSSTGSDVFHIAPSGFVNVMLTTPDGCGPNHDHAPSQRYWSVRLSLNGVHLAVPLLKLTACDNHFITYLDIYSPPPRLPAPGTVEALTATIEPDYRVTNGVLEYVVDLRNPTGVVLPLDICAVYTEAFASINPLVYFKRSYELNCDTIHEIGAYAVVRYAMRLAIPSTARSGKLDWHFGAGFAATAITVHV